jgi:hypothetical protein
MKKINLFVIMSFAVMILLLVGCKKSDTSVDLTQGLTGTYEGTLEVNGEKTTYPAIANIEKVNDYSVSIYCSSEGFDTTFVMDLYPNGDSTMLCFTDNDFETEYNHQMSGDHHMMDGSNWTSWSNHMNDEHSSDDEHYGAFSTNNHSFTYRFKTPGSEAQVSKVFNGAKTN